ncbi:MAG: DNA polymerase III subunit epsilon, partial [Alphaproteobacteria bacterium]|nr:DNA polymerase III subunit epsilon [Alphaproteobacteria bacterium]
MNNQRTIVLDTETTGFKPDEGHRIVEIGAVELFGFSLGQQFQRYINPERPMPTAAFEVHGLSSRFLANKPLFADIVEEFLAFLGDATLLIHNSDFDMNFINHHLEELGYPKLSNQVIDSVAVARRSFPNQPNTLDALCRRFNIDLSDRTHHGALKDSLLLAEVWIELNGGRQGNLALDGKTSGRLGNSDARGQASHSNMSTPTNLSQTDSNNNQQNQMIASIATA